jgi:hypothetical protein
VVERLLPKQDIVGSIPITRSKLSRGQGASTFYYTICKVAVMWVYIGLRVKSKSEKIGMMPDEKKGTILYVEDNPDNRNLIRRVLNAEGYSVVEAINAESKPLKSLKVILLI